MITGKDLMEWGMLPGPIFKTALKVLGVSQKGWGKPKVETAFREMMLNPDLFVRHELLAPIAQVMVEARKEKIVKHANEMNAKGCPVTIFGAEMIEQEALNQIRVASKLPIAVQAACMPDAHAGYGLPIGGVLATDGAVIPYAVGVDIGCRMQMTIFDWPFQLAKGAKDRLVTILNNNTVFGAGQGIDVHVEHDVLEHEAFKIPLIKKLRVIDKAREQIGTSGGGNHFVEFGMVETPDLKEPMLAVLSHSGSRGVGFAVANAYTKIAMDKRHLSDEAKHLAWLLMSEEDGQEYWNAMEMSGAFAKACHDVIHDRIRRALGMKVIARYDNHHNFAWKEKLNGRDVIVHRKGATPAGLGVHGLIPGSMTTETCLAIGKGNEASMCSSSHGAGRLMSRKAAKEKITMHQLLENLEAAGVTLIGGSVDESSMAYKDIQKVMAAQKDLVEVWGVFKPFVVKMAGEERKPWEPE
jgi:tRNA-splicing ligase RtcB